MVTLAYMEYIDKTEQQWNKHILLVNSVMADEEVMDAVERGEVWDNLTTTQLDQVLKYQDKISQTWIKKSIKPKSIKKSHNLRNLSNAVNILYKPSNYIKSSVSSMTSAEEGQPPSIEPEAWQDTHPQGEGLPYSSPPLHSNHIAVPTLH